MFITPDPLPMEFDREQRVVDAMLTAAARMQHSTMPHGLTQRVFEASIAQPAALAVDALPADFNRELQTVDSMLSAVSQGDLPHGLEQRVYDASVRHLPGSEHERSLEPLRLVGAAAERAPMHWSIWQRVSLAASVAIVGGVALWVFMSPPPAPGPSVASNQPDARRVAEISSQFESLNGLTDDLSDFESQVAYLLDATEVRSVADLNRDFDLLAQRMDL